MRDCLSIVQRLHDSEIFSGIDMKAGFHNIPVDAESSALMGVITQDGLFQYLRMTFGLLEAPMYFQYMVEDLIYNADPSLKCEPYLDDLTAHGCDLKQVWDDTLRIIKVLTDAGIMINMKKCKLLVRRFQLLGYVLYDHKI